MVNNYRYQHIMYYISLTCQTPQEGKEERGVWWPCVQWVVVPENRVWPIILNLLLSNAILVVHAHMAGHTVFVVVRDIFFAIIAFHENDLLYAWSPDPSFPLPFLFLRGLARKISIILLSTITFDQSASRSAWNIKQANKAAICTCILHECSTSIHTVGTVALSTRCGFSPSWAAATAVALEWLDWMPPQVMILSQPLRRASAIRNSSFRICQKTKWTIYLVASA